MNILYAIHILGGSLLLLLGLVQLLLRKHGRVHRVMGRLYVWTMLVVCATAMFISVQSMLKAITTGALFLFSIGLFSLYGVMSGFVLGKYKSQRQLPIGRAMVVSGIATSALMLTIAFRFWSELGIICLVFGILQVLGTRLDWIYYYRLDRELKQGAAYWIFGHSGRMIGSYIAACTAFLVNVVSCPYPIVLWLGPTVVGVLCIVVFQRRLQKSIRP